MRRPGPGDLSSGDAAAAKATEAFQGGLAPLA